MVTSTSRSRFALCITLIAALSFQSCNSQFGMINEGVLFDSRTKSKESRDEYALDRMANAVSACNLCMNIFFDLFDECIVAEDVLLYLESIFDSPLTYPFRLRSLSINKICTQAFE